MAEPTPDERPLAKAFASIAHRVPWIGRSVLQLSEPGRNAIDQIMARERAVAELSVLGNVSVAEVERVLASSPLLWRDYARMIRNRLVNDGSSWEDATG